MGNTDLNGDDRRLSDAEDQEHIDPYCTPDNPHTVTFQDITSAAFLIKSGIDRTPCSVCLLMIVMLCYVKVFIALILLFAESTSIQRLQYGTLSEEGFPAAYGKVMPSHMSLKITSKLVVLSRSPTHIK